MAIEARTILLEAIGSTRHAQRELEALERKLAGLDDDTTISIRAETNRATRRLGQFEARLKAIDRTKVDPEVSVEIGRALAQIATMRSALAAMANQRTKVDVDFDRNALREVLEFERGLQRMAVGLEKASAPARSFGSALGNVVQTIKSVTPVVNGLGILIAIKLVSGLLAVGASAAAAAGGVAVLGATLLAALGPALALAIAVVQRIVAIFDVIKKQQTAADQAKAQALTGSQQQAAAAQQAEASARAVADAERAVGDAAEQVAVAVVAAYAEMEQAAEDVQEANERLANAELNLDQSRLDIKKAEQALKDFREEAGLAQNVFEKFTDVDVSFDRSELAGALEGTDLGAEDRLELEQRILDVRKAKQGEKDATDDLKDSETALAKARQRQVEFQEKGIAASPGYVAAVKAQEDAQRNLRRAIEDSKRGSDSLIASQANAIVQAGKLSAAEERLRGVIVKLKTALKTLFGDATDAVIGAIATALERIQILFIPLKLGIDALGDAWADVIAVLSKEFVKPAWIAAFLQFFLLAADLSRVIGGEVFVQFLRIIRNIALIAGPAAVAIFEDLAGWLRQVADNIADVDNSKKTIDIMIEGFRQWASLVGAIIDLFVAFVDVVGPIGNEFVGWLTKGVKAFKRWLKSAEGTEEVREFFEDTLPAVKSLIKFLLKFGLILLRAFQISSPVLKGFIDGLTFVLDVILAVLGVLQDVVRIPFVRFLLEMVGQFLAFGAVLKVVRAVFFAVARLGGLVSILKTIGGRLVKPFVGAFNDILRFVGKFAPNLAGKVQAAVTAALKAAEKKLTAIANFGRRIVETIGKGIRTAFNFIVDAVAWYVRMLRVAFEQTAGRILAAGRFVVNKIVEGVKSIAGKLLSVGKDLLQGLINGFTTIGKRAFDAIKGLVKKIVDAVKDFLGIHSPSRVFFDIGQDMLAGLIKGFSSGDVVGFIKDNLGGLPGLAAALAKKGLIDLPLTVGGKLLEGGIDLAKGVLPGLAKGGIITSRVLAELGEQGKEAVLPLTNAVLKKLGDAIAANMTFPAPVPGGAALAAAGGSALNSRTVERSGMIIKQVDVNLPHTASGSVDPRTAAVQLTRILRGKGG